MGTKTDEKLDTLIELLSRGQPVPTAVTEPAILNGDEEATYQRFKTRLMKEAPKLLRVLAIAPEIEVATERETIEVDGKSLRGRLALLILKGWFDEPHNASLAWTELKRTGKDPGKPNVYKECDRLVEVGFLTKESDGYQAVAGMKSSIKK